MPDSEFKVLRKTCEEAHGAGDLTQLSRSEGTFADTAWGDLVDRMSCKQIGVVLRTLKLTSPAAEKGNRGLLATRLLGFRQARKSGQSIGVQDRPPVRPLPLATAPVSASTSTRQRVCHVCYVILIAQPMPPLKCNARVLFECMRARRQHSLYWIMHAYIV